MSQGFFLNEPLRDTVGTFFGKIHGVPMVYLIRSLRSHDQEHCECPGHFLCWVHCNHTDPGNFECVFDVPGGFFCEYFLDSLAMSLQCTGPGHWALSPVLNVR